MNQLITPVANSAGVQTPGYRRCRFPLLAIQFDVLFHLGDRDYLVKAVECSHDQLRVVCPSGDVPLLVPRTSHHRPGDKISHQATLRLSDQLHLNTQLQVLFCRRFSQQNFHLGLQIKSLSPQEQARMCDFLEQALAAHAAPASLFG